MSCIECLFEGSHVLVLFGVYAVVGEEYVEAVEVESHAGVGVSEVSLLCYCVTSKYCFVKYPLCVRN